LTPRFSISTVPKLRPQIANVQKKVRSIYELPELVFSRPVSATLPVGCANWYTLGLKFQSCLPPKEATEWHRHLRR
jgi:hypothetical protein